MVFPLARSSRFRASSLLAWICPAFAAAKSASADRRALRWSWSSSRASTVAGPHAVAHIDGALDQLAGDAEAQIRLGPRLDRPGHGAGQAEGHGIDGHGPHGTDRRMVGPGLMGALFVAARERPHETKGHGQECG